MKTDFISRRNFLAAAGVAGIAAALTACGGLLHTGATGTNVNDVAVLLIRR